MKGEIIELPPDATGHDRNRLPVVREGLSVLDPKRETFEERFERLKGQRVKYAGMQAHMERAAMALAAGATFRLAAKHAGVSVRQVKKYYTSQDFRTRIEELRQVMFSKVRGRVLKELEKRTEPGAIEHIELLDLLRIHDRVYGPPGGKGGASIQVAGDVNVVQHNYDTIVAALLAPESGEESADFPSYRPEELRLPEEGSFESS